LKTFEKSNKAIYINEKEAFTGLRDHDGMIRYLADYKHEELNRHSDEGPVTKTTYNILLEYGDYDLDEFFGERLPPVFDTEVEAFWRGLFEIADAVEGVHNLHICTGATSQDYHG
jgi:hypothetical protein